MDGIFFERVRKSWASASHALSRGRRQVAGVHKRWEFSCLAPRQPRALLPRGGWEAHGGPGGSRLRLQGRRAGRALPAAGCPRHFGGGHVLRRRARRSFPDQHSCRTDVTASHRCVELAGRHHASPAVGDWEVATTNLRLTTTRSQDSTVLAANARFLGVVCRWRRLATPSYESTEHSRG